MRKIALIITSFIILGACSSANQDYLVTISTPHGDMHAILYDDTPKHKENFIKLTEEKFYDSVLFHRVIEKFMIQGGDPDSKNLKPGEPLGDGGPGYTIPAEFNEKLFHIKGALAAARQGDAINPEKVSSGSQFYIVQGKPWAKDELTTDMRKLGMAAQQMIQRASQDSVKQLLTQIYENEGRDAYSKKLMEMKEYIAKTMEADVSIDISPERIEAYTTVGGTPHLDDSYTVFGQVIDGLEVIDKIAAQPKNPKDRPLQNIRMVISVEKMNKKKITKLYGYHYPETAEK